MNGVHQRRKLYNAYACPKQSEKSESLAGAIITESPNRMLARAVLLPSGAEKISLSYFGIRELSRSLRTA